MSYLFLKEAKIIKAKPKKVKPQKVKPSKVIEPKLPETTLDDFTYDDDKSDLLNDDLYESNDNFDENFYDTNTEKVSLSGGLEAFNISTDHIVTYKEARTSTEEKRPFIVSKGDNRNLVNDRDTIYKTLPKMRINSRDNQRLGFVIADKKQKTKKIKEKRTHKYRGIANESFLIYKKKPFNYKKIGYLYINDSPGAVDLYVEVVTNKGYKWLLYMLALIFCLGLFIFLKDWDGWHINLEKFTLYKTEESIKYNENDLSISFNAAPVCTDGKVNINLSSEPLEDMNYTAKIYDENENIIYISNKINAGDKIDEIELSQIPEVGTHTCRILCDSYKGERYMGSVESTLTLNVK
ncbi:MAG: hypothetical protein NC548_41095 [Lachnospiraceae bacterium]|nr:hypothetical protein [Lachnospiraceae bacterium]